MDPELFFTRDLSITEGHTYLNNAFHKVFLSDSVPAADDLLQDSRQHHRLVLGQIDALQLAQPHQVGAH